MATSDTSSSVVSWITGNADIINNIAANMLPVQRLLTGFAYVMGLAFAWKAIYTLRQYGESRTMMSSGASMKEPLIYLMVAVVFIYFPSALRMVLTTAFGNSNILEYRPVGDDSFMSGLFGNNSAVGRSLSIIIQTLGGVAFIRGWILLARASSQGQQPGGTGKGLIHIFGGILAMNIVKTLEIVNNTLYGTH